MQEDEKSFAETMFGALRLSQRAPTGSCSRAVLRSTDCERALRPRGADGNRDDDTASDVPVSRVNPRAHSESRDAIASAHRSGRPLRARASKSRVTDGQTFLHKSARRARTACVSVRAHEGDALIERR